MTDPTAYVTHMRRLIDASIRGLVASSVEWSRGLDTAAYRSGSEAHLAGALAYVLSTLHAESYDLSERIADQLEEWAANGEDLGHWVAETAPALGLDPEEIITDMRRTYLPQAEAPTPPGPEAAEATTAPPA